MVGYGPGDQLPEADRVVHLAQVAQLVGYDVLGQVRRQVDQLVVEVEVTFGRTAAPASVQVFDRDAAVGEAVGGVEPPERIVDRLADGFAVTEVVASSAGQVGAVGRLLPLGQLLSDPVAVFLDETDDRPDRSGRWGGDHDPGVRIDGRPQPFGADRTAYRVGYVACFGHELRIAERLRSVGRSVADMQSAIAHPSIGLYSESRDSFL